MISLQRFLRRLLLENFFLKVGSFVLAIILWFIVQIQGKIEQKVDLKVDTNIFQNLPEDGIIRMFKKANEVNDFISVRMKGIPSAMSKIAKQASLSIDLAPGFSDWGKEVVFEITNKNIQNIPLGIEILNINPTTISVMLDYYVKKNVDVVTDYLGAPPEGFRVDEVNVSAEHTIISGPRSIIETKTAIQSRPINISGLEIKPDQKVYSFPKTPLLVSNFVTSDPATVDLNFVIVEIMDTKEFHNLDMDIKRLEGTDTFEELTPKQVSVIIEGPRNIIKTLEAKSFRVILDVQELPPDKWREVIPKVEFPRELASRLSVKQFIPPQIRVKIIKRNSSKNNQ